MRSGLELAPEPADYFPWWSDDDRELMLGACDLHVHLAPCIYTRQTDELAFPKAARAAGYRGVLSKCHHTLNGDRLELIRNVVNDFEIHGGIVLNHYVGGLNPYAVEASLMSGGRAVWMPTLHSANHLKTFGSSSYARLSSRRAVSRSAATLHPRQPIAGLDEDGKLQPELYDIIDLVADAGAILATGHFGFDEIRPLVAEARRRGVEKVIVTHAEMEVSNLDIGQQRELADLGAYIEHVLLPCLPIYRRLDPEKIAHAIREVDAQRCILSTDMGQVYNPHPIEGMRQFAQTLLYEGVSKGELDRMLKTNPSQLLGV